MKTDLRFRRPSMFWYGDLIETRAKNAPKKQYFILDYWGCGIYRAKNLETKEVETIDYRDFKQMRFGNTDQQPDRPLNMYEVQDIFNKIYTFNKYGDSFLNVLSSLFFVSQSINESEYEFIKKHFDELVEEYKQNPPCAMLNNKPYTGKAYVVNGYNGYTTTEDHTRLVAEVNGKTTDGNGHLNYLTFPNGEYINGGCVGSVYTCNERGIA